jgi:hypothetical protein
MTRFNADRLQPFTSASRGQPVADLGLRHLVVKKCLLSLTNP